VFIILPATEPFGVTNPGGGCYPPGARDF